MDFITTFGKASPLVHSPPPPLFCIHFFSSTTTNMVVESAESSGKREPERKHSPWLFQHLPLLKRARGKIFNNHLKKAFFVGAEFIWQPTTRDGPMSFLVECWGEWVKGLEYPVTEFFFFDEPPSPWVLPNMVLLGESQKGCVLVNIHLTRHISEWERKPKIANWVGKQNNVGFQKGVKTQHTAARHFHHLDWVQDFVRVLCRHSVNVKSLCKWFINQILKQKHTKQGGAVR